MHGLLVGATKELDLLEGRLRDEERILALTGAQGDGTGVLACTNQRLLFLFVGVLRRQYLQVDWNQAHTVTYDRSTRQFAVYTRKPSKRTPPAMTVRVINLADAQTIGRRAIGLSRSRLDVL